jgi:serine/threonine protein kinase
VSGTPAYMAPEQATGDAAAIGERTDVFALGVILFEMLTGRVPFSGTAREVLEQVRTKPVPPVRKARRQVPKDLAAIVAKATARRPADRYPDMTAFARDLAAYLQTEEPPKKKRRFGFVFWVVVGLLIPSVCGGLLVPAGQKALDAAKKNLAVAERTIVKADELAADDKPEAALAVYDEAIQQHPDRGEWRLKRAEVTPSPTSITPSNSTRRVLARTACGPP